MPYKDLLCEGDIEVINFLLIIMRVFLLDQHILLNRQLYKLLSSRLLSLRLKAVNKQKKLRPRYRYNEINNLLNSATGIFWVPVF